MNDEQLMRQALAEAKLAGLEGEVPVGAVVVKDGEIIARAHNQREGGKNALCHAETMAIDAACKALGGWRLWQCELFVTLEPCPMCAGAIINSRIKRVVYGAADEKAGCCGTVVNLFALPFNHHPLVQGGLLEEECREELQTFFAALRKKKKTEPAKAKDTEE
ncbi:nucleoside deaminase [Ruminococcaceae bacterium OttesenSCG-928-A16]|nr:nucleoside deaminase [Ruminococcaceae bacterium OttesenSCG-928-A16]